MKKSSQIIFSLALVTGLSVNASAQNASITADFGSEKTIVSKNLFGIFYEDINYAGDGGLYGEMVQNRSFEFGKGGFSSVDGWKDHINKNGNISSSRIKTSKKGGLNENNPTYLKFNAKNAGDGFSNSGYRGMFLEEGKTYPGSVYLRSTDESVKSITVSLGEDSQNATKAETVISGITSEWKKFEFSLTAVSTTKNGAIALFADTAGNLDVDFVSLFQADIYRNEENGLRKDLAERLEAMHPAFVRFPGGCIVHGHKLSDRYQWKDTIGPVEERKENVNFWHNDSVHYMQSYGLGFYEYFRFCEDIGAEPIPVLSCGMSHDGELSSIKEYKQYAQDALDLIEYATGSADSKWGKKRAEAGHPEPFTLNYIGIGNEDWGADYFERYRYIAAAITKKYPNIKPIISSGWTFNGDAFNNTWKQIRTWQKGRKTRRIAGLVDEHYYNPYTWFLSNGSRYDDKNFYKRGEKEAKVFIGEYASWVEGRRNNLFASLTEAAYMTSIERNGDVVEIASYAPLFAREGFVQWAPDAIWFNSSDSYGTPNYYVQSMFMNNTSDFTIKTSVVQPDSEKSEQKVIGGTVGLGSWATTAEFKDIKVTDIDTGKVIYSSAGINGTGDFNIETMLGEWEAKNGIIVQSSTAQPSFLALDNESEIANIKNYDYELKAKKTGGAEGFLINFGVKGNNFYWWNIGGWGNTQNAIEKGVLKGDKSQFDIKPFTLETNKWYTLKIEVRGETVKCYLDGKLAQEMTDVLNFDPIYAHVGEKKDGKILVKIVNVSDSAQDVSIVLKNAPELLPTAKVTVLSGDKLAENSFDNPENIVPKEKTIDGISNNFVYSAEPYSFSILELSTK